MLWGSRLRCVRWCVRHADGVHGRPTQHSQLPEALHLSAVAALSTPPEDTSRGHQKNVIFHKGPIHLNPTPHPLRNVMDHSFAANGFTNRRPHTLTFPHHTVPGATRALAKHTARNQHHTHVQCTPSRPTVQQQSIPHDAALLLAGARSSSSSRWSLWRPILPPLLLPPSLVLRCQ